LGRSARCKQRPGQPNHSLAAPQFSPCRIAGGEYDHLRSKVEIEDLSCRQKSIFGRVWRRLRQRYTGEQRRRIIAEAMGREMQKTKFPCDLLDPRLLRLPACVEAGVRNQLLERFSLLLCAGKRFQAAASRQVEVAGQGGGNGSQGYL